MADIHEFNQDEIELIFQKFIKLSPDEKQAIFCQMFGAYQLLAGGGMGWEQRMAANGFFEYLQAKMKKPRNLEFEGMNKTPFLGGEVFGVEDKLQNQMIDNPSDDLPF